MIKLVSFSLFVSITLGTIGVIFWNQELKFVKPTPVPEDFVPVSPGDSVDLSHLLGSVEKDIFVHFYNYDCPCSRFNMKEFEFMVHDYEDRVQFLAVIQSENKSQKEIEEFEEKYGLGIPTVMDPDGKIAKALGVYSTPQAVIISKGKVFFKGNYNKARFCTSKNTKFAELALEALVNNKPAPHFPELAYVPYGCELPVNESEKFTIF